MPARATVAAVYVAGIAQGAALVTVPAIATVLTSSSGFDLSSSRYGALFAPQVVVAIAGSLAGGAFTQRLGIKRIYLIGLAADALAMGLVFGSRYFPSAHALAYVLLLLATGALGLGFGLTVPALNTLAAALFPDAVERALLVLNALLGLGTVLAPVLAAVFVGPGLWWLLPLTVACAALAVFAVSLPLAFPAATGRAGGSTRFPRRFWVFAGAAFLYGIVETMNGNWAEIAMHELLAAPAALASLALTAFWAAVTAGRLLFGTLVRGPAERAVYRALPFVCAAALALVSVLPRGDGLAGILAFALAGFGCSALLPLTIGFAQEELATLSAAVAGPLIASYQLGYGVAAFGVGPLQHLGGASLRSFFAAAAVIAFILALFAPAVLRAPRRARLDSAR